jgi:hypothetical protein
MRSPVLPPMRGEVGAAGAAGAQGAFLLVSGPLSCSRFPLGSGSGLREDREQCSRSRICSHFRSRFAAATGSSRTPPGLRMCPLLPLLPLLRTTPHPIDGFKNSGDLMADRKFLDDDQLDAILDNVPTTDAIPVGTLDQLDAAARDMAGMGHSADGPTSAHRPKTSHSGSA